MSLDKISISLYDVLGYVLPGFVILVAISILEASFVGGTHVLYLAHIVKNPIVTLVLAYFLGQVSHSIASWLKTVLHNWLTDEDNRLKTEVVQSVKNALHDFYAIDLADNRELNTLEMYQLSEAYIAISGGFIDRDVYQAREGFAKASMVAMGFLSAIFLITLIHKGAYLQMGVADQPIHLTWIVTILYSVGSAGICAVFRRQFLFFSRLKNNYTMLAFLAHRQKERANATKATVDGEDKFQPSTVAGPASTNTVNFSNTVPCNSPLAKSEDKTVEVVDDKKKI